MVVFRLVLRCTPTTFSHALAGTLVSVDLPRMRQCTSRPLTTSVSKSLLSPLERGGLFGRGAVLEERHEVGVTGGQLEGFGREGTSQLGHGADERRHLEPEGRLEGPVESGLDGASPTRGVEDDVAAVDVRPHIAVAEPFDDLDQA